MNGVEVALTTHPPRTTWFHPSPSSCARLRDWPSEFSERQVGLRRCSFGCARALAWYEPPSPPSTLHIHGSSLFGFLRRHSTGAVCAGWSNNRRGGSAHMRLTGVRIHSYAACVRRSGIACIAAVLLEPRTTPPTLASRRVR